MNDRPAYKRILLKLSGEALMGESPYGIDRATLERIVAEVAEVKMVDGKPKVQRVVAAVDCGIAVNPDNIKAQVEGGVGFGLGAVLHSKVTMKDGVVDQGNFDTYEVLRFNEMPHVEVHIVPSAEAPTGIGEPTRFALSPVRARIHLGWEAFTPLAEGLAATVAAPS